MFAQIYFYLVIDPIQYWVDDGCIARGREKVGSFKETSYLAGVRCCSADGSECVTPPDLKCPDDNMSFDRANQKCVFLGMRLCTKDQLLSGVCCRSGGFCDHHEVWTSTPDPGKKSFSLQYYNHRSYLSSF